MNLSPPKTPVKKIINKQSFGLEDICRLCNINVRISGLGRFNISSGKKSIELKLAERLSVVVGAPIVQDDNLSSIICSKCKRTFEKLEKSSNELREFQQMCILSMQQHQENVELIARTKRCHRDSPSSSSNARKKRTILSENTQTHELNVHDDFIVPPKPKDRNAVIEVRIKRNYGRSRGPYVVFSTHSHI